MRDLIVNVPAFNKEAIEKDMFIKVKYASDVNNKNIIHGVIAKVEDKTITYVTSNTVPMVVHLDKVLAGEIMINVAYGWDEPNKSAVEAIISEASTGSSIGYANLNIKTNGGNRTIAGVLFNEVIVDGIKYIQAPKFTPLFTDYTK